MAERKDKHLSGQSVDINYLVDASEKLKCVVEKSFGPVGQLCLILQANGHPILTCDGGVILEHTYFEDPIMRYITKCAISFQQRFGDGSKQFILILNELLKAVKKHVDENKTIPALQHISRGLAELYKSVLPTVFERSRNDFKREIQNDKLELLIEGVLQGKFTDTARIALVKLLHDFIKQSIKSDCVHSSFDFLTRNFSVLCLPVEGMSVDNSSVGHGFIVTKELRVSQSCNTDVVKFILLRHNLCSVESENNKIGFSSKNSVLDILNWIENDSAKLISYYKSCGVQLIICTEAISDTLLFLCKKNQIAVLNQIDSDEASFIEEITGARSMTNPFSVVESDNVQELRSVKPIKIGNGKYTHIEFVGSKLIDPNYLIMCGPTRDIIKLYNKAMLNCLKILKYSSRSNSMNLTSAVGGRWEFEFRKFLKDQSMYEDERTKCVCDILSDAVLIIPKTLIKNSFNKNKTFAEISSKMETNEYYTIDSVCGKIILYEQDIQLELKEIKFSIINHVIATATQLLRLSSVHCVKKFTQKRN